MLRSILNERMTRDQARRSLTMPQLGNGQSTTAYTITCDIAPEINFSVLSDPYAIMQAAQVQTEQRVLRISTNETGMRTTIAIAMKHQDDPFAPRIYETMELQDGFACIMEKLVTFREACIAAWGDCRLSSPPYKDSPYVQELLSVIGEHGIWEDGHPGNYALRGKQIVVLDPLYSHERYGPIPRYDPEGWQRRKMAAQRTIVDRIPDRFDPWSKVPKLGF